MPELVLSRPGHPRRKTPIEIKDVDGRGNCLLDKHFRSSREYGFPNEIVLWEGSMHRMKSASSYVIVAGCLVLAAAGSVKQAGSQPAPSPAASASLDYGFFKAKVEPVFLAKRPGHARCVVCHTFNNAPFKLVSLSPGSTTWNEEQSRRNFELIQRVAMPGFLDSKLLKHPLAEEAGGDPHHGGAQQFSSQQDPDWLTLKAFVLGEKVK